MKRFINMMSQSFVARIVVCAVAVALITAAVIAITVNSNNKKTSLSDTRFLLNTLCTVSLYDKKDSAILQGAFDVMSHYESLFSTKVAGSDIYNINHAGGAPVKVSADTIKVINEAIGYSQQSGGLFDITVGALTALWNIEGENPTVPSQERIDAARATIGYKKIAISGDTVTLEDKAAQLDLGGVAKGFIADQVRDYLRGQGVHRAIINLGGNVVTIGSKATNSPWIVGVQQPFQDRNEEVGYLYVSDKSVVTSGIYERYFVQDGKLYAHILDPRTGYPVENNLSSVTIISNDSKQGDGLSATCFLLGVDKAKELVESLPDVQAIFLTKDGQLITTKGIGDTVKFVPKDTTTAVTSK